MDNESSNEKIEDPSVSTETLKLIAGSLGELVTEEVGPRTVEPIVVEASQGEVELPKRR